ncbi:hypothetical protein [uncultured Polaribacter sp.]|uniref:hypothetical protein n=1 Tax=uncultured Polaribacter sp. TaxID=174711 RepID=UPI00259BAAE2|nr:hypothetical protein [uncultured Polaribacter sp.]
MKKKVLITSSILFLIIGIYLFVKFNFGNSSTSSIISKKLESEWDSSENIGRINNSNEKITFRKIDIIVLLNGKKIGDVNSTNPLIIDLNNDNIIVKNGIFFKSCNANFTKYIHQSFKSNTDLTSIKTDINGKINYSVNYEIKGNKSYKETKEIITNLIMQDIYKNAKSSIKFGIPEIKSNKYRTEKEKKMNNKNLIKL